MDMIDHGVYALTSVLAASGNRPRVHGNGFIQLDINPKARLHVWGDARIPRQSPETQVHDHTFGFQSHVLLGELTNICYDRVPETPVGKLYFPQYVFQPHTAQVRHGEDTVLVPTGDRVALTVSAARSNIYKAGDSYNMEPCAIHESRPLGLTVSVIIKDGPSLAQGGPAPTVFVPIGVTPDNAFDRYSAPVELLWLIIGDAMRALVTQNYRQEVR